MVERTLDLDSVFSCLSNPTRRSILHRLADNELSISEIAKPYKLKFATISKHLTVLENANLIAKRRSGKEQMVRLMPQPLLDADTYLKQYELFWEERFDALDELLKNGGKDGK